MEQAKDDKTVILRKLLLGEGYLERQMAQVHPDDAARERWERGESLIEFARRTR